MKLKAPAFAPGFFVSAILGCTPLDPGCVIGDLVDVEEDRARNVRGELLLEAFAIFCRQIARAVDDHDAGIAKVFGELVGGDKPTAVGDRGFAHRRIQELSRRFLQARQFGLHKFAVGSRAISVVAEGRRWLICHWQSAQVRGSAQRHARISHHIFVADHAHDFGKLCDEQISDLIVPLNILPRRLKIVGVGIATPVKPHKHAQGDII
jgi:hypothetical protein